MLGLLLKDLYNTRRQALWYVVMIGLFCVSSVVLNNVAFVATLGILVTISMPLTAIAYEEKDGWQKFVIASGTSIRTIVAEKYLLGMVFALVSTVGYAAVFMLVGAEANAWTEFTAPVGMQFFALAVVLPIVFRFGVEKGRTYMILAVVVLLSALIALMPVIGDLMSTGSQAVFAVAAACVPLGALLLSGVLSFQIYSKKEF